METELDILQLADYSERFTEGEASAFLIINKNITAHPCMFGFEKLPEDFETVKKLFEKIESKAKELGYSDIIGPLNHNTWMNYRWATDNYDQILFPDCTNPPYYVDYIKRLGYDTLIRSTKSAPPRLAKRKTKVLHSNATMARNVYQYYMIYLTSRAMLSLVRNYIQIFHTNISKSFMLQKSSK